jgi:hypothetical protein
LELIDEILVCAILAAVRELIALHCSSDFVTRAAFDISQERFITGPEIDQDCVERPAEHAGLGLRLLKITFEIKTVSIRRFAIPAFNDPEKLFPVGDHK